MGPGLPAPEKGLFPESRILELMSWKRVQRTGACGLLIENDLCVRDVLT